MSWSTSVKALNKREFEDKVLAEQQIPEELRKGLAEHVRRCGDGAYQGSFSGHYDAEKFNLSVSVNRWDPDKK